MNVNRFSTDGLDCPPPKPEGIDPADANYSSEWNAMLSKLNLTTVVVQTDRSPLAVEKANAFDGLGDDMVRAHLGHYDSTQYHPHLRHFFYVRTDELARGLEFVKNNLATAGLLDISAIGHFDATANAWREFWPGIKHA